MSQSLVSIIIPCYNAEDFVAEAIQSALDQSYSNCEVVVIDDGSTDGSLEIIKSFGDKIQREIGPNRGGCAARNRGIELARGEWIQFLDVDDLLLENCVESKVRLSKDPARIMCSRVQVAGSVEENLKSANWNKDRYTLSDLIVRGGPQTSAPLHRSSNLRAVNGFTDGLKCSQEYDLHLRLAVKLGLSFEVIDSVGVVIRPQPGSVSRISSAPIEEMRTYALNALIEDLDAKSENAQEVKKLVSQALVVCARGFWRRGEKAAAIKNVNFAQELSSCWADSAYRSEVIKLFAKLVGFSRFERIHNFLISFRP